MSEITGIVGLIALLILLALRVPIGVALIGVSFGGIWSMIGLNAAVSTLKVAPYSFAASWQLSSVPMFLFMGYFCFHAKITQGLFQAARVFLSWLPGGLAVASVFGTAGFAAISGSSVACAAAMGRIAIPEMLKSNYNPALASGTVAAAGTIGALIPPSIIFIIYGILAEQPIGKMFLGGATVGILTAAGYILVITIWTLLRPNAAPRTRESFTSRQRIEAIRLVVPATLLALAVFGGLFSGLFTPTEAGATGAAISILISVFLRSFTWAGFRQSLIEAFMTSSALFLIAIGAKMLTRFVALSGVDDAIAGFIMTVASEPMLLILVIAMIYLVLGMFLDPTGAMLLTLPILIPVADRAGFDMVWFGVLAVKLLEIGMITPPVGLNVFVIKSVVGERIQLSTIFNGVTKFLLADLLVLLVIVFLPAVVMFLPNLY